MILPKIFNARPIPYYESENGVLYCGDCLEIMPTLGTKVDLVLTDIPYNEVNQKSGGLRKLDREDADRLIHSTKDFVRPCIDLCSGSFYIFCGTEQISDLVSLYREHGMTTRVGAWEKTNPSPMNGSRLWVSGLEFCVFARKRNAVFNEHCKKALWACPSGKSKIHPTQKPLSLFERIVKASSNVGNTVLDFTIGSGTTAVAAINTGRKFIGIEMSKEYCEIAKQRIIEAEKEKGSRND